LVRLWAPAAAVVLETSLQRYPTDDWTIIEAGDIRETPTYAKPPVIEDKEAAHVLTVEEWNVWQRAGRPEECKVRWEFRLPMIRDGAGLAALSSLVKKEQ